MVAAGERSRFERDGYLVLPGFVPTAECAALRARMAALVDAFEPGEVASIFSTTRRDHAQDRYFLELGDQIRFFFEEEAFDEAGRLRQSKERSINKVGHALHDLDPVFDRFSRRPALAALVGALGIARPLLLQSMYIFKQPRIGGEVICHQDAAFLHTEPQSVVGLWFALEDATVENGCLHAAPGQPRGAAALAFSATWDADRDGRPRPGAPAEHGPGAARGRGGHARRPARALAALERAQPLEPLAPRLCAARDRRAGTLQCGQLAAARAGDAASRVLGPVHGTRTSRCSGRAALTVGAETG